MSKLKEKVNTLSEGPGVYIYKDAQGKIIYIGKAKSLKKRVQSYFSRYLDAKTQAMVSKIADLEYKLTPTEAQAQILEAALVKEKQPQYNIDLKDDKSFPWIRISDEEFPIVSIYRRRKNLKNNISGYYGPYTNVKLLRQAIKLIRKIFGFRSCKKMPKQACLYYRLKLCPAPCVQKIGARKYQEIIRHIRLFLEFRYEELVNKLSSALKTAVMQLKFEEAAKIRDQINSLSAIAQNLPEKSAGSPSLPQCFGGLAMPCGDIVEIEDLKNLIGLNRLPLRIEGFDISNISGKDATGAMVSFYKGFPDKNNYRRFRIKTVEKIDDYQMLREVVHRRYLRLKEEKLSLPDLILIDGGKQHLLAAQDELKKLEIDLPIVSIAKEEENIYIKGRPQPINLSRDIPALKLMRRVRDEAHRFAQKYHHLLHKKKILKE